MINSIITGRGNNSVGVEFILSESEGVEVSMQDIAGGDS